MRSYGSINAVPEVQRRPSNRNSIMFAVRAGLVTAVAAAVITLAAIANQPTTQDLLLSLPLQNTRLSSHVMNSPIQVIHNIFCNSTISFLWN